MLKNECIFESSGGGGDKCGYEDDGFNLKNLYEEIIILDSSCEM